MSGSKIGVNRLEEVVSCRKRAEGAFKEAEAEYKRVLPQPGVLYNCALRAARSAKNAVEHAGLVETQEESEAWVEVSIALDYAANISRMISDVIHDSRLEKERAV